MLAPVAASFGIGLAVTAISPLAGFCVWAGGTLTSVVVGIWRAERSPQVPTATLVTRSERKVPP
jgi:hypothetical protein